MRVPTRHSRLVALACRIYSLTIYIYPTEFRRAFGHELVVTFRNRAEDVLDEGGIMERLAFAAHIAVDCVRTWTTLSTELRDDGRSLSVSPLFVAAGVVFSAGVWYMLVVSSPRW
jgi:hypothetical protein